MGTQRPRRGLGHRRLGAAQIVFFVVAAAGPLFAIAGGVPTNYAVTGSVGVPLSFLLLAPILGLFAVGYSAMSRYITNAGAFYPYVANGVGKSTGAGIAFVTLLSYNAIQISIYGLFGWSVSTWLGTLTGSPPPWWLCALVMVLIVGALGVLRIDLNAKVLGVALCLEVAVVAIVDIALFANPAGGSVSWVPLEPSSLFTTGAGAVFAFSAAAFIGFEGAATYGEETREPSRTVGRATFAAIGLTAVLYVVSSLALAVGTGPDVIVTAAAAQGPDLLFNLAGEHLGGTFSDVAYTLFVTGQCAALLSFHNAVARYFFALGREGLLPRSLAKTSKRTGAPVAGSLTQTALALAVVSLFAIADRDPVTELFTWLGTTASTGVVVIMIAVSLSVIGFFKRRRQAENAWRRWIAPGLAILALSAVLALILANFDLLLGPAGTFLLRWGLPGLVLVAALIGFLRAEVLRTKDPGTYAAIGGPPEDEGAEPVGPRAVR
ncbi:APC family permease [Amycolatopsis sp. NPDC052450]|uniref:APC family permease n=1 Tax=Amycolatopsis sp. NPDC052450 TaxID=3363937 RepID=UPI0037C9591E